MALKAGRSGLNKKLVDLRGNLKDNFIAPKWKRNYQYTKDSYVMFESDLYKSLVNNINIVPSSDDGSHWEKVSVVEEVFNIQDISNTIIKSEFVNTLVLKKQGNHVFGYVRYKNIPPQTPLLDNLPKTLTLHFYSVFEYSNGHPASASLWQSASQLLAYGEQSTSEYIGVIDYICE